MHRRATLGRSCVKGYSTNLLAGIMHAVDCDGALSITLYGLTILVRVSWTS